MPAVALRQEHFKHLKKAFTLNNQLVKALKHAALKLCAGIRHFALLLIIYLSFHLNKGPRLLVRGRHEGTWSSFVA